MLWDLERLYFLSQDELWEQSVSLLILITDILYKVFIYIIKEIL